MGPGPDGTQPSLLWTENETNMEKLHGVEHYTKYVKDAFHRSISVGNLYTICICMYVCMYVCMCVYTCMYMYVHVCVCVCMYVCMYVCMHVYMCVYTCMYMYVCVYVCLLKMNTYKSQLQCT